MIEKEKEKEKEKENEKEEWKGSHIVFTAL
jgi:hypothetical protein